MDFAPKSPNGNLSSSDSLDRWGEEDDSEPDTQRTPRKTILVNEHNPYDLTLMSTNEDDDSEYSNGQRITQSEDESSIDSSTKGQKKADKVFFRCI